MVNTKNRLKSVAPQLFNDPFPYGFFVDEMPAPILDATKPGAARALEALASVELSEGGA